MVCTEPGEKDKPCSGHLKHYATAPRDVTDKLSPGHVLFRCQRCGTLYEGEPMRHVR